MRAAFFATVIAFLSSPLAAMAESTKDALENFGLLGTFSSNCAQDENMARYTFNVPSFGNPNLAIIAIMSLANENGTITNGTITEAHLKVNFSIDSAVRVTEDKIKLSVALTDQKFEDQNGRAVQGGVAGNFPPGVHDLVISKLGNKISWPGSGAVLEKCLN